MLNLKMRAKSMKLLKYLLSAVVTALLSIGSASLQAESCPVPMLEPSLNVSLPCAMVGNEQFAISLEFTEPVGAPEGLYWRLSGAGNSTCSWSPANCAIIGAEGEGFDLILPVELEDGKYTAGLEYYPSFDLDGMYWRYVYHELMDTENAIVLKKGTPNANGAFESLYVLEGDFVNVDKMKDFQMDSDVTAPQKQLAIGEEMTLRVFHFNDLHSELRSISGSRGDTHRFSQMVKIVKEAKANAADNEVVLFVSAGDDHTGNPFDELLGYKKDGSDFQMSAAYRAYSAAGIDVAVIGNHDLDRGATVLSKAIEADANFPVISTNLYGSDHLNAEHYNPAVIGTAKGLRIGIIGMTTPEYALLKQQDDPNFSSGELLKVLENTLPYIEELADVILIIDHVGYNGVIDGVVRHKVETGDVQIAELAASLTNKPVMLIGGHTHTILNENGLKTIHSGVPIAQAGGKGSHLGEVTFSLYNSGMGLRTHATAKLHTLKRRDERERTTSAPDYDPSNYEQDSDLDLAFEETIMQPIYTLLDGKLQEVIGIAGDSQDISTAQTLADRYVAESAIHNFMNDAIVTRSVNFPFAEGEQQNVDIAAFNASAVSQGVNPSEDITFNDWYGVMPYADVIMVATVTGAELKALLHSNAQRVVRPEEMVENEGDLVTTDPGVFISRGFLHFSSDLRYTIKLGNDVSEAVAQDITFKGQPINDDDSFKIAFGDYIGGGGEGWKGQTEVDGKANIGFDLNALPKNDTGLIYRNEIIAFIKENITVDKTTNAMKDGRLVIIP